MMDMTKIASGLTRGDDGIWRAQGHESVSYPRDGNEACFAIEPTSYWFGHRNDCIRALVRHFPPPAGEPVFDMGGGNGFVSLGLSEAGYETVVVEPGPEGAANARRRGLPNVICATAETAGIAPHRVAAAGVFDVVEHMQDDLAFLASLRRLIRPAGWLYVTVPAYTWLWSQEDVHAGHFRRYTRASFGQLLTASGFVPEFMTYFFQPLVPAILLLRAAPYRLGLAGQTRPAEGDHTLKDGIPGRAIRAAFRDELSHIERLRPMRFGSSLLVAARAG